ncbi:ABC-type antimicrobial peptide transport system [Desulfocucumis palustris]|uniref:ABC-type antimicrobial peptide transport system n=1 Tax=Desulfocucumis palustris TaxID=1898651 RepID=A0A2L2XG09_9FIRM|nr:ABC transporter permease [Desulfocucumis palustris]GBF35062.1 ABC-type antimicrobial peptide transport system [Desulfocucumis palustris]
MKALNKKLWRTIKSTKGQFLAVAAVVAVGISVYIAMSTAYLNLERSKEQLYRNYNFADYYFHVIKAPEQVTRQIEELPGVTAATGRIQKDVPILKEDVQRATARIISYPLPLEGEVNRFKLLSGRIFQEYPPGGGIEILAEPQYAAANNLTFNDKINIVAEEREVPLTLAGTAISPEFIYPIKDAASLLPDPRSFAIILMPQSQAQQILNLTGQINQVAVKLAPGADQEKIADQIESILEPYGNLASYPRKQQISNAMLQGELDSLQASSKFLPAIFLGIAVAIQFVMLGRMIKAQRMQIGVMKALGYNNLQIMLHYTGYAQVVALSGALLGSLLGLLLASAISQAYAQYFNLPETIGGVNARAIFLGFALSIGVGTLAGLFAARTVTVINPAESMRPEPPKGFGKIFIENWTWLWRKLSPTWKMSIRSAVRNKIRFGVSLLGVTFAVGMLVVAVFSNDSVDYMIDRHYFQEQHYDLLVRFSAPVKDGELLNIYRLEGVLKGEPVFEIPARITYHGRTEENLLTGVPPDLTLKKISGQREETLIPGDEGLLISQRTARKLGVKPGDTVTVETLLGIGPSRRAQIMVTGINSQMIGESSYLSINLANRILQERRLASGVMLSIQPGTEKSIEGRLNDMTEIASISSRQKELDNFNKNLESMIYSISIMIFFALVLGFAIVYNSSIISFAERKRELASLRVVGFSSAEVSGLLLEETLLQTVAGVALGLPFGLFMAKSYVQAISTDLFTMPVVVYPLTYFLSALGGTLFIITAHLLASRGVKKLDLVDVLKNRD